MRLVFRGFGRWRVSWKATDRASRWNSPKSESFLETYRSYESITNAAGPCARSIGMCRISSTCAAMKRRQCLANGIDIASFVLWTSRDSTASNFHTVSALWSNTTGRVCSERKRDRDASAFVRESRPLCFAKSNVASPHLRRTRARPAAPWTETRTRSESRPDF